MDNKQQFTLWYFIGALVLLVATQTFVARPHSTPERYSGGQGVSAAWSFAERPLAVI